MARRKLDEINAGSMADIAFLLLVFFLVVTTMKNDQGVPRLLPPPVQDPENPPEFRDRDVYEILVNLNDDLFVENEKMDINQLRRNAKKFLLANGDNVLSPLKPGEGEFEDYPERSVLLNMDAVRAEVYAHETELADLESKQEKLLLGTDFEKLADVEKSIKSVQGKLDKALAKKYALEYFPGFASLPGAAMISVQNDNSCTYETYLLVNNELEGALNDLRNEVSLSKFGIAYDDLDSDNEDDKKKILAIRQVYPQRISEAEPLDIGGYND